MAVARTVRGTTLVIEMIVARADPEATLVGEEHLCEAQPENAQATTIRPRTADPGNLDAQDSASFADTQTSANQPHATTQVKRLTTASLLTITGTVNACNRKLNP